MTDRGDKRPLGMSIVKGGSGAETAATPPIAGPDGAPLRHDPAEFLVGNGKGPESAKEWFKVHEGYVAQAKQWIESKKFPYKSRTDLYRHAVVRHLRWLAEIEGETENDVLVQLSMMDDDTAREEFQLRFLKSIEKTAATVAQILQVPGGSREASEYIRRLRKRLARMREGFYKTQYLAMFDSRFAPYEQAELVLVEGGLGAAGETGIGVNGDGYDGGDELDDVDNFDHDHDHFADMPDDL